MSTRYREVNESLHAATATNPPDDGEESDASDDGQEVRVHLRKVETTSLERKDDRLGPLRAREDGGRQAAGLDQDEDAANGSRRETVLTLHLTRVAWQKAARRSDGDDDVGPGLGSSRPLVTVELALSLPQSLL